MVFSIKKHNDLVILKYDSGFVSLSFYPTDPKCLTEDGYRMMKEGRKEGRMKEGRMKEGRKDEGRKEKLL
jgi:hypothetical protein